MTDCYISGIKKAALQRAALFIYFSATTAAAVITAYAEDNKKRDDYEPDNLIIEKFAEAVIHSGFPFIPFILQRLIVSTLLLYESISYIATAYFSRQE